MNTSTKDIRKILKQRKIPRQIYGLLLIKEMSVSDLANEIYKNKNVRVGITNWIDKLLRMNLISRTDTNQITGKKRLFKANISAFGNFNAKEKMFIEAFTMRFWNPHRSDPLTAFSNILDEALIIKKIFNLRKSIGRYDPQKDLERYTKNKEIFWKEKEFRDKFLDQIRDKKEVNNFRRDFIFMSLLVPESLYGSFLGEINIMGAPLHTAYALLK